MAMNPPVPIPARGYHHADKDMAIESLQPHVANGLIVFNRNHKVLNQQLEYWPQADHNDGPDGLEMLWQAATRGMVSVSGAVRSGKRRGAVDMTGYGGA